MPVEQLIIRAGKKPLSPRGIMRMDGYGVNLQLRLVGLSTASGAAVLGEARTLARVAAMLWRVTPKVPAQKVLWDPCTFCFPYPRGPYLSDASGHNSKPNFQTAHVM